MAVLVHKTDGVTDEWRAVADERTWFDYTQAEHEGELLVYLHTFRRVRERLDRRHDHLTWKHHTTKLASRYRPGEWRSREEWEERPPYGLEVVPRVVRARSGRA